MQDLFYGKEILNRVSFLREDGEFLSKAINHASTNFVFFNKLNPLAIKDGEKSAKLLRSKADDFLKPILNKWVGLNNEEHVDVRAESGEFPTILFLGIEDESVGLNVSDPSTYLTYKDYKGIPYFAIEVENSPSILAHLSSIHPIIEIDSMMKSLKFNLDDSSMFSYAKTFFDWLDRNKFCPGCGSKVIPVNAGGKLKCTSDAEKKCPVNAVSVTNVSFPRTDAVIITAITNPERTKILLGKNNRYKLGNMYSCIAGFIEPSETVEVASKREIWEETGVTCSDIIISCTQPWPYPANLMIGCIAIVEFNGVNEIINLEHDKELADAKWFDTADIKNWLKGDIHENNPENIMIPMKEAIAHRLMETVCNYENSKL